MITIEKVKEIAKKEFPNLKLEKVIDLVGLNLYCLIFAPQSPDDPHNEPVLSMESVVNKLTSKLEWLDMLDEMDYEGKRIEINILESKQRVL